MPRPSALGKMSPQKSLQISPQTSPQISPQGIPFSWFPLRRAASCPAGRGRERKESAPQPMPGGRETAGGGHAVKNAERRGMMRMPKAVVNSQHELGRS